MPKKIILLSAARFEIEQLLSTNRERFTYFEIGVGVEEAAIRSQRILPYCRDQQVLFVGSAGIFSDNFEIKLYNVDHISWQPYEIREKHAHYPIQNPQPILLGHKFQKNNNKLNHAQVYCGPHITDSDSKNLSPSKTTLENIELFTVAQRLAGICEFGAILGATNKIGSNSQSEWRSNFKEVARLTADTIGKML